MRYIPTYCDGCERLALVAANRISNGLARCDECDAQARSLPGESYGEADLDLFDALVAALAEVGVGRHNAPSLRSQLDGGPAHPGRGLRRLAHVVPALGILELIVNGEPSSMRKAEGMLVVLLDSLSNGRRHSGVPSSESHRPIKSNIG